MGNITFVWDSLPERLREKIVTEALRQNWDAFKAWQKANVAKDQKMKKWQYIKDATKRAEAAEYFRKMFGLPEAPKPEKAAEDTTPVATDDGVKPAEAASETQA